MDAVSPDLLQSLGTLLRGTPSSSSVGEWSSLPCLWHVPGHGLPAVEWLLTPAYTIMLKSVRLTIIRKATLSVLSGMSQCLFTGHLQGFQTTKDCRVHSS